MDQHNSASSMDVPIEIEEDDNASVDSEQLMADIDEFISESPETEVVVELYDYEDESESNASGCEVKSMSADEPTSSSGSVVKSFDFDYQKIQVNQPVVLLSKLDQHEMAKYFTNKENIRGHEIAKHSTSKQNISEGINSKSDCKKSEESSEVKQSVWCDDMDGSLSELSVSDFSLSGSDIEDDNMPTIVKSNSAADSDSKAINVKKSDVSRVDQRRNSKETLAASHATNSKNVQSKSKSPMPSSQSRVSGTSSLNTSKNTVKFKGKPESSAKSMSKSLPCETNSIGMTKCSPKETSFKSTTKSSPSEEIISKHDKNHFQGKQVVEQKENVKKDEEYLKQTECGSSDESNKNWRYELTLTNFNIQELTNESFRKFINLASDCAMYFSPPTASNKPTEGGVSLYFGDFAAIQSAMQKLGQVLFTSTSKLQGQIIGRKMLPLRTVASGSKANFGAKWKIVNHVKMFFTLYTAWAEKLKQLVQVKDWKKADERHEKFAKIQRVPTSVTKQFLSLLFPFSINIHSPNSQNASKKTCAESFYSIDVKYASQDLMETVLGCYQNLSITIPSSLLPLTKLYVSNVKPKAMPPGHKGIRSGAKKPCQHEYAKHGRLFPCKNHPPHRQQLKQHDHPHRYHQHRVVTGQSSPGANKAFVNPHSTTQHKSDSSMSSSTPEQTRDRKRSSSTMEDTRLLGKKSRFNQLEEKTASQPLVISGDSQDEPAVNTSCDMNDVKKMAEAQGLDPNNSDVLCILEMQKQLVSMQSLISLPQPVQQQPTVESDPERSTEEIQIAEAEQKLRESIATGQKQLFEIEEKLKTSKRKIQHSKHDSSVSEAQDYNKPSASVAPPPNLNDQPLDFKKPQPRVELAVKADEMRSKITAVVKKPIATFKKPLPITSRKAPIKAEDCALPLEFGKNVVKVNPKDIQQQSSEGQERGQERSKFGRGANQLQGRGLNTDNRFKNRDGTQKRGKISRWSSVDDRDVSLKDRRGSDGISLQHGIGVTNQQSEIGMKVLGNGLLPTPTESLETSWGRNDAREPDSKSNERRKFSEQGTAKSGRNFMSRDRDSQGREGRANIPQSQNQCRREYFDEDRGDGYQNKRSVDMQDRLPHKRGLSQLSQAGNKGLSIIEKLQKEAFARGKGDDGFKKSSSSDRDLSGAREQFRGGDDQFYQYEEETSWTDHEDSQYGWDNQNKAKMDSAGRGPQSHSQRDRDYSGVKGQRKPFSRRGSESQSVSHLNDEYYGGSADSMFKPNSTDTGARINRGRGNREDERYMEYDGGYQDEGQSSGGADRLGEMGFGGNRRGQDPGSAKRPKLDNYQSREAGVMDEWNQQEHDGDGRGGPHSFGRDKGGSKGYNVMHKAGRETGSDLSDREKQQNNYYQQGDEYDEGNVWEYGHRGVARGIEMADANRGGKGGNIATRGRGFERHRGGKSDIRGRGGVKRGGFGAAGRGGFQDKGSVGDGYEQSDAFSGGGHRTGAARGRGGHFGKGDYDGILHEDSGHYDDNKRWSFDNDQGDGVEFNDSRDQYSHGDYGRPGNVDAGIGNKQSFSQMERRGFENMKGDSNRGHVGKSFGFDNKGDCGNFGNSDIGHDGNSFGSSDKGGGGNFGSSKRGRGGHNFGGSNSDIGHVSSTYVRSDKDRGGGSFDGNDRGRADDRYGSSDRGRDGGINRGRGGGNFGSSDRGRDGGINRGRDGGINRGRGGGNFGSSDRGRGGNFGSSDRNRGGSDGHFGSRDSGASSFGRIDSNNGRGRSTGNSSRGRGDNNSKVQSSHGGLGLLGAVPTSSYGEIGDEVGRDFAPPMNRGVNFY